VSWRRSAAALGFGACAVLAAGIIAAIVRGPDSVQSTSSQVVVASASPSPAATHPAVVRPAAQHADPPKTHTVHRQKPPTVLPFTGSAPVPPTFALALLLVASGSWILARWPALSYEAARGLSALARSGGSRRRPPSDGAIDRLRSPGHQ